MGRRPNLSGIERAQRALTEHLGPVAAGSVRRPHAGWVRATRDALGMTQAQLAARMGVSRGRITQIEQAERGHLIQLDTLQRAAEAMNCTLVYAFVPTGGYETVINTQAEAKAASLTARVRHTMDLENQRPTEAALEQVEARAAAELIASGQLWNI